MKDKQAAMGKSEKKRGKFRFNFIDLLIIALLALMLLAVLGSAVSRREGKREYLLTLRLSDYDVTQAEGGQPLPSAEERVTDASGKEIYGVLEEDYEQGSALLVIRVNALMQGSDPTMAGIRLYVGQKLDLRCGHLLCHGATLEEITEVKNNDGK